MPPGNETLKIVEFGFNHDAPTGEGQCYKTEDGRWWEDRYRPDSVVPLPTGVIVGDHVGGGIKPRR